MKTNTWHGCYPSNWKGMIVPEAMSHPAKYSSKLIRRIYEHIREEGWACEGDAVLDPFGGVALGALDAMRMGYAWTGIELEAKFHGLGNENIGMWNKMYSEMPRWGSAQLLNGDSRFLLDLLAGAVQVTVSSPPYENQDVNYARNGLKENGDKSYKRPYMDGQTDHYGHTPGQLGAMKAEGFELAISSPPFLQSEGGAVVPSKYKDDPTFMARHAAGNASSNAYGKTEGQLSSMNPNGFELAVSSPPYEAVEVQKNAKSIDREKQYQAYKKSGGGQTFEQFCHTQDIHSQGYGTTPGQLADADDFWLAARTIVEQTYAALATGGHACWVVKDYVKKGQIVPFSEQWRTLCEAVGFVTVHEHHAMLVHSKQMTLDGGVKIKESKSFFRRNAEKKGSPRIDWETVYCMVKE